MADPSYSELARRVELLEQALLKIAGASSIDEILGADAPRSAQVQLGPDRETSPRAGLGGVDKHSSVEDKIALFLRRFRGREDICARAWENPQKGIKGWMPFTNGVSFKKDSSLANRVPLTAAIVDRHLRNNDLHVGLYPMMQGDKTAVLACDFDRASFKKDALLYVVSCRKHGLSPLLEVSRSGNGAHVWIFFEEPIPARLARQVGHALLAESEGVFDSFDRFFPAQDLLPSSAHGTARLGNLIALPLAGQHRSAGRTVFVDDDFTPLADQFLALSSVTVATEKQFVALKREFYKGDVEQIVAPAPSVKELRGVAAKNKGKTVSLTHSDKIRIDTSLLDSTTLKALKALGTFPNPKFYQTQAMRFSTWNIPRLIIRFSHEEDTLTLDRGVLDSAVKVLKTAGYKVSRRSKTPKPASVAFAFCGTLRPDQARAQKAVEKYQTGILTAPPGSGKTVIAMSLIASRGVATAVIVNSKELVNQWKRAAEEFLGETSVGQYGAGKKNLTGRLDVIMAQSITRKDADVSFLSKYGYLIIDECHGVGAPSFTTVLSELNIRYVNGLTATPIRSDGLDPIIPMLCGPIRYSMEQVGSLEKRLVIHETSFESQSTTEKGPVNMTELYNELSHDTSRNALIADLVSRSVGAGENTLVLVNRRDHIDLLHKLLDPFNFPVFELHGGQSEKERKAVRAALQTAENFALLAMNKVAGEGVDLPQLDTLFLASPVSFKGNIIQQIGRITRGDNTSGESSSATVHDFNDHLVPSLGRMFIKRRNTIKKAGFVET